MARTIAEFIAAHGIKFSAEMTDRNPNMSDMPAGSTHWRCTLRKGRRSMVVYFSQGPAICRAPTAEDVLDCLASDAASVSQADGFESWALELGFDPDSRKAEKTYRATEQQTERLRGLLGSDALEALMFRTERP